MGKRGKGMGPDIGMALGKRGMAMGMMRQAVTIGIFMLFVLFIIPAVYAEDVIKPFIFKTLDGRVLDSKSMSGTPMLINVGSHGWPECKKEAPELQKAYLAYRDRGIGFIGVFVGSKDTEIKKFVETYQITFPVGRESGIAEILGIKRLPETVFISRSGKILKRDAGEIVYGDLVSGIEAILK